MGMVLLAFETSQHSPQWQTTPPNPSQAGLTPGNQGFSSEPKGDQGDQPTTGGQAAGGFLSCGASDRPWGLMFVFSLVLLPLPNILFG